MSEIVDPSDRVDPELALGGFPVAVAEVVQVEVAAPWGGEHELLVLSGESVERPERGGLEWNGAVAAVGLGVPDAAVAVQRGGRRRHPVRGRCRGAPARAIRPVAAATRTSGPNCGPSRPTSAFSSSQDSNGRCPTRGRWRFSTPCLAGLLLIIPDLTARASVWRSAWVASNRCPVWDRHPPSGDLSGLQFVDRQAAERGRCFAEQPAELRDHLGLGVVLGEGDLDEL